MALGDRTGQITQLTFQKGKSVSLYGRCLIEAAASVDEDWKEFSLTIPWARFQTIVVAAGRTLANVTLPQLEQIFIDEVKAQIEHLASSTITAP